jgi:hypothetical protein
MRGEGEAGGAGRDQGNASRSGGSRPAQMGHPDATGLPHPTNHPSGSDGDGRHSSGSCDLSAADFGIPERVPCPFCAGAETELHSAFGGQLSTSTYWCRHCRTAFEWFKWERK